MRLYLQYYNAEFKSLITCICKLSKIAVSGNPEKCCVIQGNSEHIHNTGVLDWLCPDFVIVTPKEKGGRG